MILIKGRNFRSTIHGIDKHYRRIHGQLQRDRIQTTQNGLYAMLQPAHSLADKAIELAQPHLLPQPHGLSGKDIQRTWVRVLFCRLVVVFGGWEGRPFYFTRTLGGPLQFV